MTSEDGPELRLIRKERWIARRNRLIASKRFQRLAARLPGLRSIARKRSSAMFDLVAGFTYTQILLACVESGLLDALAPGAGALEKLAERLNLPDDALDRLLRAAAALDLAVETAPGRWMLGETGAVLHGNAGARAMIRHHRLLYCDLADPLALLRQNRAEPTRLSNFWDYAGSADQADAYSELMAASHAAVAEEVLTAFRFRGLASLLDVGGGSGTFATSVAARYPDIRLGVFDRPPVIANFSGPSGTELHAGDFLTDPIPRGYSAISLIRILHDHDDGQALALLRAVHAALAKDGRLLIAEPMSEVPGAERVGDAYFGLYLWAMRSGRPRSHRTIGAMLREAGFRASVVVPTNLPVVTSMIVASH